MSEIPDAAASLWEAVRRALGRLVSTTHIRSLPLDVPPPPMLAHALVSPTTPAGKRENEWMPQASVRRHFGPQAEPGGGDADLALVAVTVSANGAAMPEGSACVQGVSLIGSDIRTHRQPIFDEYGVLLGLRGGTLAIEGGSVHMAPARIAPAQVMRLTFAPPQLPVPRAKKRSEDPLAVPIRIESKSSLGLRAPMTRARQQPPEGMRFAEAFGAQRQELARASKIDLEDVALLGVYPQVPVPAVDRLEMGDESRLLLWLKPEALVAAAQGKTPRLATLIIGRQLSTGQLIQIQTSGQ